MFTLALLGNGTYGLSVIVVLPVLKGSKRTFIIKHLAWLISCLGVFVLDGFVSFVAARSYLLSGKSRRHYFLLNLVLATISGTPAGVF